MDLDAGLLYGSKSDRQRQPLEQSKIDMHVQPLSLLSGEPAGDGEQLFAHRGEMVQAHLHAEIGQVCSEGTRAVQNDTDTGR